MTKKFLAAMVLAFALVIAGGQAPRAEAYEVYVGSYSDGTAVYLLTETVNQKSRNTSYRFTCTVRAGRDYIDYGFETMGGRIYYRNSEGYQGHIDDGYSPVAARIYYYLRDNY